MLKVPQFKSKYQPIRRTPTLLEMEAVECGAASLGMILAYYGELCRLLSCVVLVAYLVMVVRLLILLMRLKVTIYRRRKGFKIDLEGLRQIACPYIVFWNFNHFLVVEGFSKKQVFLNDPATGRRLSTIRDCDEIIVLHRGKVVQRGTHDDLSKVEGYYLELIKSKGGTVA
ncbi:MAG: hypothetical protein KME29_24785 [Calothrix sp. FI2-JRJ7]|jgi:ABC-type bacteriocin/lantibiotic exporter with double-glycine peptidase domain|nr:hypothetical protein [Calothrix sp. FI2-JRJ7]